MEGDAVVQRILSKCTNLSFYRMVRPIIDMFLKQIKINKHSGIQHSLTLHSNLRLLHAWCAKHECDSRCQVCSCDM